MVCGRWATRDVRRSAETRVYRPTDQASLPGPLRRLYPRPAALPPFHEADMIIRNRTAPDIAQASVRIWS
jgi:hypothetical protein